MLLRYDVPALIAEVRRGDCGPDVNSCLLHEGRWVVVLDETDQPRAAIVHESLHALYAGPLTCQGLRDEKGKRRELL